MSAEKIDRAAGYELYIAAIASDGTVGEWELVASFTKARAMLASGLTSGTYYAFKVRAIGANGYGDFSDPVTHMSL